MIAIKIKKKTQELRSQGLPYVLHKFYGDHIYKQEIIYLLQRDLSLPLPALRRRGTAEKQIRFLAGKQDMQGFTDYLPEHRRHIGLIIDAGARCAAIFVDDSIIAYLWMIGGDYFDRELRYQLHCDYDQLLQGVFIHPDYRGSSVLIELLDYTWDHYRRQGYRRVLGMVDQSNWASVRMHQRLGFEEIGLRLRSHKLLTLRWTSDEKYQGKCLLRETP